MPSKRFSHRALQSTSSAQQISAEGLEIALGVRPLTEADAIDIWIARWLRIRRKDLIQRYACDPRRIYEIWEGTRFSGSRAKAWAIMQERHPGLVDRVDPGNHKRLSRAIHAEAQAHALAVLQIDGWKKDHTRLTYAPDFGPDCAAMLRHV